MDLITQYSDIILKKIMMKIQKDKKSKERAELVKLEMAETGSGVSLYFLDNEYYIVQDASMPGRIVLIDDDKQRLSWPSSKFELYE